MKKLISMAIVLMGAVMFACKEEVNLGALDNFPPTVMSVTPDGTTKKGLPFDVKVFLVDGPSSPLATADVSFQDSLGNVIYSTTKTLTGVKDSVIITSADIESTTLDLGQYNVVIHAVDKGGNVTDKTVSFRVSDNLYAAKNKKMFLAGEFNGWGADELTLISAYTWQIKNVNLAKGKWKFKNTPDWTDQDWGDGNCDGTMEIATGGGADTNCGYSGLVNITFNDNTLKYTIAPAVTFEHKVDNLYLLGSFNNFTGVNSAFTLTANNTWQLDEIRMKKGDQLRFASTAFGGDTFGASGTDGVAAAGTGNITLGDSYADAFYKVIFNDKTLAYTITVARFPYPETMFLVGGGTSGGWDAGQAQAFRKVDAGKFEIYAHITANGEFKYLPTKGTFNGDYGPIGADAGNATGAITQDGESNAKVVDDGFYRIYLDFTTNTFAVDKTVWGIVGDATGSWDVDKDMTYTGGTTWAIDVTLGATGEYKFRANDGWTLNYGKDTEGTLKKDGGNIATPGAGSYHVTINFASTGYTYTITPN